MSPAILRWLQSRSMIGSVEGERSANFAANELDVAAKNRGARTRRLRIPQVILFRHVCDLRLRACPRRRFGKHTVRSIPNRAPIRRAPEWEWSRRNEGGIRRPLA